MFVGSFVCVLGSKYDNMASRNPATSATIGESQPCHKWRVATLPQFASRNPACYGCFCRVCVVTYPYVHHACSLLPLDPCSIRCGGGYFGCGGTHSGGRPSGRGGAAALRGAPKPTEPRALAVGFGLGTNTHTLHPWESDHPQDSEPMKIVPLPLPALVRI